MSLEQLRIRNFQCHSSLDISLDPHVTTIVGSSDSGKSAIIRALHWTVFNKPSGDSFRKDGTQSTVVGLKFDCGSKLVRKKSNRVNKMTLNKKEYVAFGSDVPEPISTSLNMSEICFSAQHDPPFWLSSTAGQVSRELNAIVNLDVIDTTLKNLASFLRKIRAEKDATRERLEEAKTEKDGFEYVEELSEDYEVLEVQEEEVAQKASRLASIESLVEEASQSSRTAQTLKRAHSEGFLVVELGDEAKKKWEESRGLHSLVVKAVGERRVANPDIPTDEEMSLVSDLGKQTFQAQEDADVLRRLVNRVVLMQEESEVELPTSEDVVEIEELGKEYRQICEELEHLEECLVEVDKISLKVGYWKELVVLNQKELDEKSGGICPLCGNKLEK